MQTATASILIVDDSSTMRVIVRDMLARLGYRNIEEAEDGQSALAKIRGRSFTLIVSDWHMTPMSGIELLREVKRISTPGSNRFIMATSESGWAGKTTAKMDHVDAYIVKPFTIDDLRKAIDQATRR